MVSVKKKRKNTNTKNQGRLGENGTFKKGPEGNEGMAVRLAEEILLQAQG